MRNVPTSVAERTVNLGPALEVTNCLGDNMSQFEGCACMNNGVVAFVNDGIYYLTPDGYNALKSLQDAGFSDRSFMVLCSADPYYDVPAGHEEEWKRLRATRS